MAKPEDITLDDKANQWDRIVTADDSTEIANKAIIARYVYATNLMDLDSFDGYVAEDYVEDQPIPGQEPGIEGLKEAYKIFAGPFSDAVFVFVDLFCRGRPRLRPRRDQRHERRRVLRHPADEQEDLVDGHAPLPAEGQQGHARLVQRRHRRDARPAGRRPGASRPAAARSAAGHADGRARHARGVQGDHAQADRRGLGEGQPRPRRRALPSRGDLPQRADAAGRARGHEDDRADGARTRSRTTGSGST